MEAELRMVEQLQSRRDRKPAHPWRATGLYQTDCSALATTARA
jgi:hypothetical protein